MRLFSVGSKPWYACLSHITPLYILRQSDNSFFLTAGVAFFSNSVNENGIVTPGKEREFKIEFVGDSITCGYGVDDPVKEHHFKTSTEDATKTYAFKTAQALNADWSFVSVSGWGIISGYTGDAKKNANSVIPRVYDKLGFSWGNTIFGINPGNIS